MYSIARGYFMYNFAAWFVGKSLCYIEWKASEADLSFVWLGRPNNMAASEIIKQTARQKWSIVQYTSRDWYISQYGKKDKRVFIDMPDGLSQEKGVKLRFHLSGCGCGCGCGKFRSRWYKISERDSTYAVRQKKRMRWRMRQISIAPCCDRSGKPSGKDCGKDHWFPRITETSMVERLFMYV